jgi:hypothetical protein
MEIWKNRRHEQHAMMETLVQAPPFSPSRSSWRWLKPVVWWFIVLAAILGGLIGWRYYTHEHFRKKVEALREKGVVLELTPRLQAWVTKWEQHLPSFAQDLLTYLEVSATVEGQRIDAPDLQLIATLPNLVAIRVDNTAAVTDETLGYFARVRSLQSVALNKTRVTDRGLRHFATMPALEQVSISNSRVTLEGLMYLQGLQHLQRVQLNHQGGRLVEVDPLTMTVERKHDAASWNSSFITVRGRFTTGIALPEKLHAYVSCEGNGRTIQMPAVLEKRGKDEYEIVTTKSRAFVPHGVYEVSIVLVPSYGPGRHVAGVIDRQLVTARVKAEALIAPQ